MNSQFRRTQQWLTFTHQWLLFNAKQQDVFDAGRRIAAVLSGKNKPIYSRQDQFAGDHVIVINSKGAFEFQALSYTFLFALNWEIIADQEIYANPEIFANPA